MTRPGPPPASRPEPALHPHCAACGSRDIVADAWASWDAKNGCWVLQAVFDHTECRGCGTTGTTTTLVWIPIDGTEKEEPPE